MRLCRRAAEEHGCVQSILWITERLHQDGMFGLAIPWLLEGAIRGHTRCTLLLIEQYFINANPPPLALVNYWTKILTHWDGAGEKANAHSENWFRQEIRSGIKEEVKVSLRKSCCVCQKKASDTQEFETCALCKVYSYCSKECQSIH